MSVSDARLRHGRTPGERLGVLHISITALLHREVDTLIRDDAVLPALVDIDDQDQIRISIDDDDIVIGHGLDLDADADVDISIDIDIDSNSNLDLDFGSVLQTGTSSSSVQRGQAQIGESVSLLRYVESDIPDFEANPRLFCFIREGGTDAVCTGNRLVYEVINHNERVLAVCHNRAQVHVILGFVCEFFFMKTENVIDNVYSYESAGQGAVSVARRDVLTDEVRDRRLGLDVRSDVRMLSGWEDHKRVGVCHPSFGS